MRYEFIQPFVDSIRSVLQTVLGCEVTNGAAALVPGGLVTGEVMIIVHVTGDSEGSVTMALDGATASRVCSAMTGTACDGTSVESLDALGELANMITGKATSVLHDLGHSFTVFPPIVLAAENMREKTAGVEMVRIPVRSAQGEISINIAMKTN